MWCNFNVPQRLLHPGVSNHQRLDCLLRRLFRRKSKKASKHRATGFVRGIHRSPVNSPHKGPVTHKLFPFDDVIILLDILYACLDPFYASILFHHEPMQALHHEMAFGLVKWTWFWQERVTIIICGFRAWLSCGHSYIWVTHDYRSLSIHWRHIYVMASDVTTVFPQLVDNEMNNKARITGFLMGVHRWAGGLPAWKVPAMRAVFSCYMYNVFIYYFNAYARCSWRYMADLADFKLCLFYIFYRTQFLLTLLLDGVSPMGIPKWPAMGSIEFLC